jgi:hypothetical protein
VQCDQWAPVWEKLRDTAKPVQPHDVWDLRAARDMGPPPSKAHRKRLALKAARPEITIARPRPAPDTSARAHKIEAMNLGREIARMVRPQDFMAPKPLDRVRPAPQPPKAQLRNEPADPFAARRRLKRDHMLAMSKMVYKVYEPTLEDILFAFGSVEAWETAKAK